MKLFSITSNKKHTGKTYISSLIISYLTELTKKVCYYKPFVMDVKDGKFFDIEYIKKTTNLNASDIFTSFATTGNISPLHSIGINIDTRDITDLLDDTSKRYDYMIFESLCLYDPIKWSYNFTDLLFDIPQDIEVSFIPVIEYDENVISSTLEEIEIIHARGFKISTVVINANRDLYVSKEVTEYIKNQIAPLNILFIEFDNNAGLGKIRDVKYRDIFKYVI